ncbi:MAG: type VII toxin-antitoxin system MntA family adenylyltransferase antitoxin [Gemmatimonadota bacterium]
MNHPLASAVDQARLNAVCMRLGLRLLVLFGSRAHGVPMPHQDSDCDLALVLAEPESAVRFWDYHAALAELFPELTLDLVFVQRADPLFRWEILNSGILLCGEPDDFLELRAFAYRDFVDSADLRALERTLSEKKLAHIRRQLRVAP